MCKGGVGAGVFVSASVGGEGEVSLIRARFCTVNKDKVFVSYKENTEKQASQLWAKRPPCLSGSGLATPECGHNDQK